jgi:serine/threonine protein kinase
MHRGIKPSNILFNDHGSYVDVKIADFGWSIQVAKEDVYTSKDTFTSNAGTRRWMAPEVWDVDHDLGQTAHGYSAKADIYIWVDTLSHFDREPPI